MFGSSAEFPTRTEYVIGRRDQRFVRGKNAPLPGEEGARRCLLCGHGPSDHHLRKMLVEDGFPSVRQQPFAAFYRAFGSPGYRNISGGDVNGR